MDLHSIHHSIYGIEMVHLLKLSLSRFLFLPDFHDDCWYQCCQGYRSTPPHVTPAQNVSNCFDLGQNHPTCDAEIVVRHQSKEDREEKEMQGDT